MRKITLLILLGLLHSLLLCEMFTQTFGSNYDDKSYSIIKTNDGNFLIGGYKTPYEGSPPKSWWLKMDSIGNMMWEKTYTYSATVEDKVFSIKQTSDDGYVLVGFKNKQYVTGGRDFVLFKTDSLGEPIYDERFFGGDEEDIAHSVSELYDGGFILAGDTRSYGAGGRDVWLVRTNSSGEEIWNKTYGDVGSGDLCNSVIETNDKGFALTGRKWSTFFGDDNVWVQKTDSLGNKLWEITLNTSSGYGNEIQQTADDGYIIAGTITSYTAGSSDFGLIKITSTGSEEWVKRYGGEEYDEATSVKQTSDGGYIIAGYTYSYGEGEADVWLIKVDSDGNEEWNKTYGGVNDDRGYSIEITSDNGFIIAGYTNSYGAGDYDAWVLKTDQYGNVTSIDESSNLVNNYELMQNYPNPFNPITDIRFIIPTATVANLKVYNIYGQLISELVKDCLDAGIYEVSFDASDLNSGIYFYTLEVNDLSLTKKMILIK